MIIAYGYTNIEQTQQTIKAIKNMAMPPKIPRKKNRIFIPINQRHPSRSNVNISPGSLMLKDAILKNKYISELLFKKQQETKENIVNGNTSATICAGAGK